MKKYSFTEERETIGDVPVDSGTVSLAFGQQGYGSKEAALASNDALYSMIRTYAKDWSGTLWNPYSNSGVIKNPGGDGHCTVDVCRVAVKLRPACKWIDLMTYNPANNDHSRETIQLFLAKAEVKNGVSPNGEDAIAIARQGVAPRDIEFFAGDCGRVYVEGKVSGHCIQVHRDEHRNGTLTIFGITYEIDRQDAE